jgi:nicotinic acid mononucleotide adenylyltransferase
MLLEQNKSESKSKSVEYTLALGDDTFMDLSEWKWRRSKDIIEILQGRIVIFRRLTKVDTSKTNNSSNEEEGPVDDKLKDRINLIADELKQTCPDLKHNLRIMDVELSPISSSLARECKDEEGLSSMLSDKVVNYIKDHKMYAFGKD